MWLPSLLFGLHAGALADRRGHWRVMMIVAGLGRAALLASIQAALRGQQGALTCHAVRRSILLAVDRTSLRDLLYAGPV